ncbi:retrotransposon-like protein 1, partial [Xiphophorus maculatus]|uniref:retrotransposon-like protein 1 n=1 Tax=Xiphophorus maculatus TaxID=8083 RepID=UPI000C6D0ECD
MVIKEQILQKTDERTTWSSNRTVNPVRSGPVRTQQADIKLLDLDPASRSQAWNSTGQARLVGWHLQTVLIRCGPGPPNLPGLSFPPDVPQSQFYLIKTNPRNRPHTRPGPTPADHLARHDAMLHALLDQQTFQGQLMDQLKTTVSELASQLASGMQPLNLAGAANPAPSPRAEPPAPPEPAGLPRGREISPPTPEHYSGEIGKCGGFLLQCSIVFARAPGSFPDDSAKIAYMVGLLKGKALKWAEAKFSLIALTQTALDTFIDEFKQTFGHAESSAEISYRLWNLKQASRSVAEFAIDFRTLAAMSGWNDEALKGAFIQALDDTLKDELVCRDEPADLEGLISLAIRIDNRLRGRARGRKEIKPVFFSNNPVQDTSDDASPNALSPDEPMQGEPTSDHGSPGGWLLRFEIPTFSSRLPLHQPKSPLVLGFPWLRRHNPHLNWVEERVDAWSRSCHATCLQSARPNPRCDVTREDQEEKQDLSRIPPEYHDLHSVFRKNKALSLPPHRPYDCVIDLLPGAPLPSSRLYNISRPERESMLTYINESLAAGIIRPSTSPLGAGFFFVSKKDGSLRPCIDFKCLNQITIKNKYPLPLLSSAFEPVQGATVFTKLDLRNAYHLVRIREGDEWKTAFKTPVGHFEYLVMPFGLTNAPAVFQSLINDVLRDYLDEFVFVYLDDILIFSKNMTEHKRHVRLVLQRLLENSLYVKAEKCEFHVPSISFLGFILESGRVKPDPGRIRAVLEWPTPASRKQLQRFLGFANFYRRFIRNFSQTAGPMTCLTSTKSQFSWTPEADAAFSVLKQKFADAPVLIQPDPAQQFTVEVDASDSGVGAVLSQVLPSDHKLHPCAFFSRRLSPAERNYDVGDRELLAVKLAFAEWRHWLEGAALPVVVWTDHKNLSYLQAAKRLNPRQSRWSLFFSRFNFLISYRPGSKNVKPDALSRQFSSDDEAPVVDTIIPSSCVLGAVSWDISDQVIAAQQSDPDPGTGPPDRIYVPLSVRPRLIHWAHASPFSGHPGTSRTVALIRRSFWWSSLHRDVKEYVSACPTCARNKSLHQPPCGLLQPLPIPARPWSHVALDFVTGLPPSKGFTVILTVVDRFSKACHLVPLRKLPSALETAMLLIKHVFRLHGIPTEILSDRGPQFVS